MNDLKPVIDKKVVGNGPIVIAGPCSAETEEQVIWTARQLAEQGIKIFRAGIWKPRTKPGGFEGVGSIGLQWLRRVKEETGMLTATEVAMRSHVEEALATGVDILWLGARTTANPFAVQEIADAIAESGKDPAVLVKNPVNPDLELWIGALQRLYNAGVRRLATVHRGFSSYGQHLYRNLPQWYIPIELRRRYPNLPMLCDPSHIGGKRELIAPLSQQAMDMSFDGLIIESHCYPDEAWSDAAQQVAPEELGKILKGLSLSDADAPADTLEVLREKIDSCDVELLEVLERRMEISREIGKFKKEKRLPVVQIGRHDEVIRSRMAMGESLGLNPEFVKRILALIHEESVYQQLLKKK